MIRPFRHTPCSRGGSMRLAYVVMAVVLFAVAPAAAQGSGLSLSRNNAITTLNPVTPPISTLFDPSTGDLLGTSFPQPENYVSYSEPLSNPNDGPLVLFQLSDPTQPLFLSKTTDGNLRIASYAEMTATAFAARAQSGPDGGALLAWLNDQGFAFEHALESSAADGSRAFYAAFSRAGCTVHYVHSQTWPFGLVPFLLLRQPSGTYFVSPGFGGVRLTTTGTTEGLTPAQVALALTACASPIRDEAMDASREFLGDCAVELANYLASCGSLLNTTATCSACVIEGASCTLLSPILALQCLAVLEMASTNPANPTGGNCLSCLQDILGGDLDGCEIPGPGSCLHSDPCVLTASCEFGFCVAQSQHDCNDDLRCTQDSCLFGGACAHVPLDCSDSNSCTSDTCSAETGCVNTPDCLGCGGPCVPPATCTATGCQCPPGMAYCGGRCIGVGFDPRNCGGCGNVCGNGQVCLGGQCVCSSGAPSCNGTCCNTGQACVNCTCVLLDPDQSRCDEPWAGYLAQTSGGTCIVEPGSAGVRIVCPCDTNLCEGAPYLCDGVPHNAYCCP